MRHGTSSFWSKAVCSLVLLVSAEPAALAADRALLIGINDYVDERIPDLRGCEADIEAVRQLLVNDYAFPPDQIRVLLSREATRGNILDAIDRFLIAGTQPGDRVLLAYSGHGSQKAVTQPKPDEPDGRDEILCCSDYDTRTQANCIVDDELAERLAKLDGRNVVVIVDACHSGTITRSIGGRQRSIEVIDSAQSVPKYIPPPRAAGTRDIFYRPPTAYAANSPTNAGAGQLRSDGKASVAALVGAGQVVDELRANFVALSGCGDAQTAEEIRVRIGEQFARRGAFTWLLVEGLSGPADADRNGEVSYAEITDFVNQRLRDPRIDLTQQPELHTRQALFEQPFLGRALSSAGRAKVLDVAGDRVTVNRGAQHGVVAEQAFQVSDPGGGAGTILIESVEQFVATGRIQGELAVQRGDALEAARIPYTAGGICLWIAPPEQIDDSEGLHARVQKLVAGIDGIELTDSPTQADRLLRITREAAGISAGIFGRYGTLRTTRVYRDAAALVADLRQRLIGELMIVQLTRLESRMSDLDLQLWVAGGRTTFIAYEDESRQETIRFGFRASRDCYVTLISVDSAGQVRWDLLEPGFRATAGVDYSLPPSGEEPLYVFPPAGRDFVFALATSEPLRTEQLGARSVSDVGTGDAIDLIVRAIGKRQGKTSNAQPGIDGVVQLIREGWGAASVTIDTLSE